MANWAYTNYIIEGPKDTLQKIYDAIIITKENEEHTKWEADVLDNLGLCWEDFKIDGMKCNTRGKIFPDTVSLDNTLSFEAEEAWGLTDLKEVLKHFLNNLKIYYNVEETNEEVYATNDAEGKYFPERFYVDTCIDGEYDSDYFNTKEEAFKWISTLTLGRVENEKDIEDFEADYEDSDTCNENFIHIHEFDIIEENEET